MFRYLSFARLPVRLYALTALFGTGLLTLAGISLDGQWNGMRTQRVEQMQAMSEVATKVIESDRALAAAGLMSEAEAKTRAIAQLGQMTYGNGNYFVVIDENSNNAGHPNPKFIGTQRPRNGGRQGIQLERGRPAESPA